jgi:signal transduction histidine kinase/HAMP domain-containing protein
VLALMPADFHDAGLDLSNVPGIRESGTDRRRFISPPYLSVRTGEPVVLLIQDLPRTGKIVGELKLGLLQQEIVNLMAQPGNDFLFITDQHGTLLAHPDVRAVNERNNVSDLALFRARPDTGHLLRDGRTWVLGVSTRVAKTGWVIVDQVPLSQFGQAYVQMILQIVLASLAIWAMLRWGLRNQLEREICRPLEELSRQTTAVTAGDFQAVAPRPGTQATFLELDQLAADFTIMVSRLQARDAQLLEYQDHLEDQVVRRSEQLAQSRQLLSATLDALPACIAILDGQGTILATNQKWQRFASPANGLVFGADVGQDYRAVCARLQAGTAPIREVAMGLSSFMAGEAEACRLDYDFDRGEQQRWFAALGTRFSVGATCHLVLMHLDVTAQKRMELQLQQAQKMESIGQLAAGIAHEINTPIQFIGDNLIFLRGAFRDILGLRIPVQALLEKLRAGSDTADSARVAGEALDKADLEFLQEDIPKAITQSLDGVGRVSKIVNAMKDFSHPGSATRTPSDLNRAIESTTLVCHNEWKYVAELELDLAPGLPPVPCFPDQFNQVMLNLIINAAHAIADRQKDAPAGKGRISIRTRAVGGCAEIRVEDTGTGIPDTIRPRIFDPFFTTKPVGKGTGQGLAIAYAIIVKQHGGTITVASETGQGATFILQLPFDATGEAGPPPTSSSGPQDEPGGPVAKP